MVLQEQYDEAMLEFSRGEYEPAIVRFRQMLDQYPDHFEARMALGMALYRQGNYSEAILEGHRAEQLKPTEQLVHTNLSLFYMKAGDRVKAEHHGLQARIAGWKEGASSGSPNESELQMAAPKPQSQVFKSPPKKFPDMPWKKKPAPPASS